MSRYTATKTNGNNIAYGFDHVLGYFYQEWLGGEPEDWHPAIRAGWDYGETEQPYNNPHEDESTLYHLWKIGYESNVYDTPFMDFDSKFHKLTGMALAEMLSETTGVDPEHIYKASLDLPF